MLVSQLVLSNFTNHDQTVVHLPPRGLVLVSGANGSGKSSLTEAVSTACWGKTLRGEDPWRDGVAGAVACTTDRVVVERRVTPSGSKKLHWSFVHGETPVFDTSAKSAEALQREVGDFDRWRRTHVFSSQDAAHFSTSTDAERKALIERILGLTALDQAHARCKERLAEASRQCQALVVEHAGAVADVRRARERCAQLQESLQAAELEEPEPALIDVDPAELSAAQHALRAADAAALAAQVDFRRQQSVVAQARADARAELKRVERAAELHRAGQCAECGQSTDHLMPDQQQEATAHAAVARVEEEWRRLGEQHPARLLELQQRARSAQLEVSRLQQLERESTFAREQHAGWTARQQDRAARRSRFEQQLKQLTDSILDAELERMEIAQNLFDAERAEAHLQTAERVLGMKGVRASVLAGALAGMEDVANCWLPRVGTGMRLELKPYTERKSGDVSDSISIVVHGAGGGRGYRAASGGERRRIDVVLLLALAEAAGAEGTLWFDEVFDAIDDVAGISEALLELAQDRCVVVITHSEALAAKIPAVLRIRMQGGKVL